MPLDWASAVIALRGEEPSALAVLLFGSRAAGAHGPYSDVDLRVVTAGSPRQRDRFYLIESDGRLVHVSIGSRSLSELLMQAGDPERWPWMQATYARAQVLWEADGVVRLLNQVIAASTPANCPYLAQLPYAFETLLEQVAKVKNAHAAGDFAQAASFAANVATFAWRTLDAVSPPRPMSGDAAALADRLTLGAAIPGYTTNMTICLGLRPDARDLNGLLAASIALAASVVVWLTAQAPRLNLPPEVADLLSSGQADRYVRQMLPTGIAGARAS